MASKGAAMRFLIHGSIGELFKRGYLESHPDWDFTFVRINPWGILRPYL